MATDTFEIGRRNGKRYKLTRDRLGNQQACDDRYQQNRRWFLTVEDEYVGNFRLKREAFEAMDEMLKM